MIRNNMMKCFAMGILLLLAGASVVPCSAGQSKNQPPEFPIITGPHYGKVNTEYTFTASLTDPEGDQYFMLLNWGDGNFSDWLGPFNSGEQSTFTHSWSEPGNYSILVKVKDTFGEESGWSAAFYITIVRLHPGFFIGTFKCITLTEDLVVLGSKSFFVFPAVPIFNKDTTIILSITSLRYPGESFTFGVGGVAIP